MIHFQLSIIKFQFKKKMDKANYTTNDKSRYPLSTEGLDFIQRQIELIYSVAELHGRNYILKDSTASANGIIVVDGEMMPLKNSPLNYIQVIETYDTLEADGMVFEKARVRRHAEYVGVQTGKGCYEASLFKTLTTIEEMKPHLMPKGAIVMWSGATNAIPTGWALCDGKKGTPNLSGRFIVGVGKSSDGDMNYQLNKTGGEEKVLLTADECALPEHRHGLDPQTIKYGGTKTVTVATTYGTGGSSGSEYSTYYEKQLADSPHNNIPPYYVLAYIMKII